MESATRITVRAAEPSDEPAWRMLWAEYCNFYQTAVAEEVTQATWRRILDPALPMIGRVAERDGVVIGFSNSILHEGTWTADPICYLEDLFVAAEARGSGAGRALMQDIVDLARASGWSPLYWHTQAGNAAARRLYDQFLEADDFVRYRLFL